MVFSCRGCLLGSHASNRGRKSTLVSVLVKPVRCLQSWQEKGRHPDLNNRTDLQPGFSGLNRPVFAAAPLLGSCNKSGFLLTSESADKLESTPSPQELTEITGEAA